ncbi:Cell wall integrity and stress response component 4 [Savitreella phatthalungensis]
MGACTQTCSGFAFAILQASVCWCSNFAPGSTVSSSTCDEGCPGFPSDNCGSSANGAYAYYQLAQPLGTSSAGAAGTTAATMTSSTATTAAATGNGNANNGNNGNANAVRTTSSTVAGGLTTVVVTQSAASARATTVTQTNSVQPSIIIITVPASSSPTVTPSPTRTTSGATGVTNTRSTVSASSTALTSGSQSLQSNSGGSSFFSSPGKVAGTFVAVGIVALALIGLLAWWILRRQSQKSVANGGYARNDSPESAGAFSEKSGGRSGSHPALHRPAGHGAATATGAGAGAGLAAGVAGLFRAGDKTRSNNDRVSPIHWPEQGAGAHNAAAGNGNYVLPVDQRLDPRPMLMRFDSNYSRHSLRDDEDYSRRVLTVTNPSQ